MPDLCPKGIDLGVKPSAPSFISPVSVQPQTTLVSVETQTIEARDEMEDRRQRKTGFSNLSLGSYVQSSQRD